MNILKHMSEKETPYKLIITTYTNDRHTNTMLVSDFNYYDSEEALDDVFDYLVERERKREVVIQEFGGFKWQPYPVIKRIVKCVWENPIEHWDREEQLEDGERI